MKWATVADISTSQFQKDGDEADPPDGDPLHPIHLRPRPVYRVRYT